MTMTPPKKQAVWLLLLNDNRKLQRILKRKKQCRTFLKRKPGIRMR